VTHEQNRLRPEGKANAFERFVTPAVVTLAAAVMLAVCMPAKAADSLSDDLNLFLQWFPGEYDNYEQHWQDLEDKVEQVHEHIHHIFLKVDAPQVGDNVFFVQQYMDGDPSNVYRHRLYSLTEDKQENAIRLTIYSYKDEPKYLNAHLNPAILKALSKDELIERPGCEVFWKLNNEGYFDGYMKERACSFVSQRSGKKIYITDTLRLTEDEIWIQDEAFDEQGNRIFGNLAGIPHKNRKVRYFSGWAGVKVKGPAATTEDDEWHFNSEVLIHNEGHIVPILTEGGEPSGYSVQLAQLTYQNVPTPIQTLKIVDDATGEAAVYSWANVGADRIGINVRWAQTGLTLSETQYGFDVESAE